MKKKILELPLFTNELLEEPKITLDAADLIVSMICSDEGVERKVDIRFVKQRSYRVRNDIYCTSWHIDGATHTVCEIINSDWVSELKEAASPEWREFWKMNHFMIYDPDIGCVEVVAEAVFLE